MYCMGGNHGTKLLKVILAQSADNIMYKDSISERNTIRYVLISARIE